MVYTAVHLVTHHICMLINHKFQSLSPASCPIIHRRVWISYSHAIQIKELTYTDLHDFEMPLTFLDLRISSNTSYGNLYSLRTYNMCNNHEAESLHACCNVFCVYSHKRPYNQRCISHRYHSWDTLFKTKKVRIFVFPPSFSIWLRG